MNEPVFTLSNPAGLYDPAPNGYSHVASVSAGARLVFIAGQGGEDERGRLSPDFAEQVRQALSNLRTALESAGASTREVVKLTVLIVDHSEERLHIFGRQLQAAFGDGAGGPASIGTARPPGITCADPGARSALCSPRDCGP